MFRKRALKLYMSEFFINPPPPLPQVKLRKIESAFKYLLDTNPLFSKWIIFLWCWNEWNWVPNNANPLWLVTIKESNVDSYGDLQNQICVSFSGKICWISYLELFIGRWPIRFIPRINMRSHNFRRQISRVTVMGRFCVHQMQSEGQ